MARKRKVFPNTLAYAIHLVDSGRSIGGAEGLYVGRRMRGEEPMRPCPADCRFCKEEACPSLT